MEISELKNKLAHLDIPQCSAENNCNMWNNYDWSRLGNEWTENIRITLERDPIKWKKSILDNLMRKYIQSNSIILEIGPGGGRWTEYLLLLAKKIILADISHKCIKICKVRFRNFPNIEYFLIEKELRFPSNFIDFVWSFDAFVHINPPIIYDYVENINKMLKPGGIAIIHHAGSESGYKSLESRKRGMRSKMTEKLMLEILQHFNLKIIEQSSHLVASTGDFTTIFQKT